jgi:hypothetical protein
MSKDYKKAIRNLESLLADDSHLSVEDLRKELTDDGVNVNAFLTRFEGAVRKGLQYQMKKAAENDQAKLSLKQIFGDLGEKSKAELEKLFEDVRQGLFGEHLKQAANARCRNKTDKDTSETELRSWLEDISAASDE